MNKNKRLVVVCGATASGKTALAIDLAKQLNAEIFSADARQFYREMNIGTAKPTAEELAQVPHHFINNLSIHDEYTAGIYEQEMIAALDIYFQTKDVAILCGGSGLFVKAVCQGFEEKTEIPDEIRDKVRTMSLRDMQLQLMELDAEFYAQVDRQNPRRLTRALEVILTSGKKMSEQHTGAQKERQFSITTIGLELPREELYARINQRVDTMLADGLEAEATALYPFRALQALQTVGYQEWFRFLDGQQTREEAIHFIKQNSRNYAKRQLTWFSKTDGIRWFHSNAVEDMMAFIG